MLSRRLAIVIFTVVLSACNGNNGFSSTPAISPPGYRSLALAQAQTALEQLHRRPSKGKIKHVVIIIQENRSFNNLFYGFRGAKTTKYGYDSSGNKIRLQPVVLETTWDLNHSSVAYFDSCNGTGSIPGTSCQMNGFDKETWQCNQAGFPPCPNSDPPYSYVPQNETKPYFNMGKHYVVADQMYPSDFDESSFVSHQYIISAQANASVDFPRGVWGCEGGSGDTIYMIGPDRQIPYGKEAPCLSATSLGQEADSAGVSWAYYTSPIGGNGAYWNAFQANRYVYYGSDWNEDVITPQTQFFNDVSNGKLRQISWITPTCQNSDHASCGSNTGPDWVASIVNAIGQSKYWDHTAIFIFWDDPGGWYDPEPPPYVDYDGLGIRVPLIIVSPYAKKAYVSHVVYEHGSILKFVEDQFHLGRLSASDARATSPEKDCFDFKKPPRKFKVIPTVHNKDYFMHQPLDLRPPDTE